MEELTPIPNIDQVKERIREKLCPYCGAPDPYYDNIEIDAEEARQVVSCGECEKHWTEFYAFFKVILSDAPEGREFRVMMTESDLTALYPIAQERREQ